MRRIRRILSGMEQPPHIMVVDDDREIRDLLARFLEKHRIRSPPCAIREKPGAPGRTATTSSSCST